MLSLAGGKDFVFVLWSLISHVMLETGLRKVKGIEKRFILTLGR